MAVWKKPRHRFNIRWNANIFTKHSSQLPEMMHCWLMLICRCDRKAFASYRAGEEMSPEIQNPGPVTHSPLFAAYSLISCAFHIHMTLPLSPSLLTPNSNHTFIRPLLCAQGAYGNIGNVSSDSSQSHPFGILFLLQRIQGAFAFVSVIHF